MARYQGQHQLLWCALARAQMGAYKRTHYAWKKESDLPASKRKGGGGESEILSMWGLCLFVCLLQLRFSITLRDLRMDLSNS